MLVVGGMELENRLEEYEFSLKGGTVATKTFTGHPLSKHGETTSAVFLISFGTWCYLPSIVVSLFMFSRKKNTGNHSFDLLRCWVFWSQPALYMKDAFLTHSNQFLRPFGTVKMFMGRTCCHEVSLVIEEFGYGDSTKQCCARPGQMLSRKWGWLVRLFLMDI